MKATIVLDVCAECRQPIPPDRASLSVYFARLLCPICYAAETRRTNDEAEIWALEWLFVWSTI